MSFVCDHILSSASLTWHQQLVVSVGISFNLIIIRVDQTNEQSHASSSQYESAERGRSYPLRFARSTVGEVTTIRTTPVEVMISQDVDRDISEPDKYRLEPMKDSWNGM